MSDNPLLALSKAMNLDINLNVFDAPLSHSSEIKRARITGTARPIHNFGDFNINRCVFTHFSISHTNLRICDIKDSRFSESKFVSDKFSNASHIFCNFFNVEFEKCTYKNNVTQGSEFYNCKFHSCNFSNGIFKSCVFIDCEFINCRSENNPFDRCVFSGTSFNKSEIQISSIISNLGLDKTKFSSCRWRSARRRHGFEYIHPDNVAEAALHLASTPLERFAAEFYKSGTATKGGTELDDALDVTKWAGEFSNLIGLKEIIESLTRFISMLYESNKILTHSILMFQQSCRSLSSYLAEIATSQDLSLVGADAIATRMLRDYAEAVDAVTADEPDEITIHVDGPFSPEVYRKTLSPLFKASPLEIAKITPRNSADLSLIGTPSAIMAAVAFLFSTRTRIELSRIKSRSNPKIAPETTSLWSKTASAKAIILGRSDLKMTQLIELSVLLPATNIVARFNFGVSSKVISDIRGKIKGIVSFDADESDWDISGDDEL